MMRIARLAVAGGMAGALLAGVFATHVAAASDLLQPMSVHQTAFEYDDYLRFAPDEGASNSPSDQQPPIEQPDLEPVVRYVAPRRTASPGPWTLPQPRLLANHGIKIGGWIQQGITFSNHSTVNGFNGFVATNDLDGEYQMNQLWLFLDRQADTGGYGWAVGGHIDMLYGSDWRFGINPGLEDNINSIGGQTYGMVIPQLYAEVAYNDLSVKLGHFAGILDYEIIPAVGNPFYSHSYSYGYTAPQLVTGALADWKVSDRFSLQGGFHRGWFMFEDLNHHLDFMGGFKLNSYSGRSSLAYAITYGPQDPAGAQDTFAHSFVLKYQVSDPLQYVLVQNLGLVNDGAPGGRDAEWYGVNQYLLYKINPKWSANLRFEWLRDDDGVAVVSPAAVMPPLRTFNGAGFAGDFYELTAGLNWRPHPNFLVRPEVRWDSYDGLPGNVGQPFNDGLSNDQVTFGCDLVITY